MFFLDRMLVGGIRFVLDTVAKAAAAESDDDVDSLREQLLNAQLQFELGEITAEELAEVEERVLPLLRQNRGAAIGRGADGGLSAEVTFGGDESDEPGTHG